MSWTIRPEPTDEHERQALLEALEQALGDDRGPAYAARWWRSGFDELRGGAPEEPWSQPCVVEP